VRGPRITGDEKVSSGRRGRCVECGKPRVGSDGSAWGKMDPRGEDDSISPGRELVEKMFRFWTEPD